MIIRPIVGVICYPRASIDQANIRLLPTFINSVLFFGAVVFGLERSPSTLGGMAFDPEELSLGAGLLNISTCRFLYLWDGP